MHALQPSPANLRPVKRSKTAPRPALYQRKHPHRSVAIETTIKLTVNIAISLAALTALVHLLPQRAEQVTKLQELRLAIRSTDERVQQTQARFSLLFDSGQARAIMQEQSNRTATNQRRIILKEPLQNSQKNTVNKQNPSGDTAPLFNPESAMATGRVNRGF